MGLLEGVNINLPLRSVETPVANNPRDATAREPPRSTRKKCKQNILGLIHLKKARHTHTRNCSSMEDIEAILTVVSYRLCDRCSHSDTRVDILCDASGCRVRN